jgi:stage V sporulation protein SpoVS
VVVVVVVTTQFHRRVFLRGRGMRMVLASLLKAAAAAQGQVQVRQHVHAFAAGLDYVNDDWLDVWTVPATITRYVVTAGAQ